MCSKTKLFEHFDQNLYPYCKYLDLIRYHYTYITDTTFWSNFLIQLGANFPPTEPDFAQLDPILFQLGPNLALTSLQIDPTLF